MNAEKAIPTVLLVDEMQSDADTTCSWLQANGYNVRSARSVGDALDDATDFTAAARPSVILLGATLSPHDCQCVADYLQEFTDLQHIPIVALSADTNESAAGETELFTQIENLEMLAPLINHSTLIESATKKAAVAAV